MERRPRTGTAKSFGARVPRKRVRVSLSCPVTLSTSVRSSSPFIRPARFTGTRAIVLQVLYGNVRIRTL